MPTLGCQCARASAAHDSLLMNFAMRGIGALASDVWAAVCSEARGPAGATGDAGLTRSSHNLLSALSAHGQWLWGPTIHGEAPWLSLPGGLRLIMHGAPT